MPNDPRQGAPAVARAIAVLAALAARGPLTGTAIARLLGLQKSSVGDVCGSLAVEEMLLRRRDQAYILGPHLERLGSAIGMSPRLFELFDRAVSREAALDGLTVTLDVLQGHEVVCLAARLGPMPLPLTPRPGLRTPGLSSAAGRAILSTAPLAQLRAMLLAFAAHQSVRSEEIDGVVSSTRPSARGEESVPLLVDHPNGMRHLAAGVPSSPDHPLFAAVVLHLPLRDEAIDLGRTGEAALRAAETIGAGARRAARVAWE